MASATDGD